MATENQIMDFLNEQLFKPLLGEYAAGWINWITFTLILEAFIILLILGLIRVISGRRTIKVKLTAPKLPKRAPHIPVEKLAGLEALAISTNGAMQILEKLQTRKKIGSDMFEQLSSIYKEQLITVEERITETLDSAERERLEKLYDESISPATPAAAKASSPTPPITPSPPPSEMTVPSGPPSGPPSGGPPNGPPKGRPKGPPPPPPPSEKKKKT